MSNEIILSQKEIENRIFTIRDVQVMIDRDLAEMYQVEVKRLNEQVKRNIERFPKTFRFQLNHNEKDKLVAICDRFKMLKHSSSNPYAFTEQGVAMLSAVLRSEIAVKVSIQIINTFIEMRRIFSGYSGLLQRMEGIEKKQMETDHKFEKVFKALESKNEIPTEGIFFDGQVFDAYELACRIIRSAEKNIILIDNFIDDTTLTQLAKKKKGVNVLLLSKHINKQLELDIEKANKQFGSFELKSFNKSHDRFLIIDKIHVYHLGASLKDLGQKWFAFSKMDKSSVESIINSVEEMTCSFS